MKKKKYKYKRNSMHYVKTDEAKIECCHLDNKYSIAWVEFSIFRFLHPIQSTHGYPGISGRIASHEIRFRILKRYGDA